MKRSSVSLVFNIFLGIGALMLIITAVICYNIKQFEAKAVKTTGTVVDLLQRSSSGSKRSTTYSPVVTYDDRKGVKHRYIASFSSNPPGYNTGESVEIYYDPANPDDAKISGWGEYIGAIVTGILALVFGLTGVIYHIVTRIKRSRNTRLRQFGQLVQADFLSVDMNRSVHVNNRHPFYIRCEGKNPLTGQKSSFKSGFIWSDPTPFITPHQKIDVYVDQRNSRKYFVDLSFLPQ